MIIDTTAASNPGVVKRVLAIEDEAELVPEPMPSGVYKCQSCGCMTLYTQGCTYCRPRGVNDARD
jgi:hypothetical protein